MPPGGMFGIRRRGRGTAQQIQMCGSTTSVATRGSS